MKLCYVLGSAMALFVMASGVETANAQKLSNAEKCRKACDDEQHTCMVNNPQTKQPCAASWQLCFAKCPK